MRAIPGSRTILVFSAELSILLGAMLCTLMLNALLVAQEAAAGAALQKAAGRPLLTESVDESQTTTLRGNTHPLARPESDLGVAPATLPMNRMLLVLRRSSDQETALRKLLDDQQDKTSPNYHKWLSPEQFGQQFGPTDTDIQTITAWLQSHGFEVGSTKGRTVLEFSGSASQVQRAFHTAIHKYIVNGEQHWANASDPQIPTALTPAVAGISSLNNFPKRAMNVPAGSFWRDKAAGKIHVVKSQFTFPTGCVENDSSSDACDYGIGPYDFATIYNVTPLWSAGINGAGETIAIVGESNINIDDVTNFRSMFGLPANNPTVILNGPDPGIQDDESEADIDVQWSGAVAPGATIDFVVSQSTETTAGVDLSAVYIIENNLAPVMSESYGECELGLGTAGNQFYNTLWQQAAAQGITVFISAGDNGAAGCDNFDASSPSPAEYGLQVSGFASTPYNVAVGGTDFEDFSNPGSYWSTTNNSTTQASALSYIPESTWNDSCTNVLFSTVGFSTNAETNCNDSRLIPSYDVPEGGSGGVSGCTTPSGSAPANCAGGYAKPAWQTGTGVPADGKRDIPDVSLFASNGFLGSFYIICQSDQTYGTCNLSSDSYFLGFGGTSVSSPAFAGIMALVNQETGSRQGNANYVLYKLAAQQPAAFHDVTVGTIAMPCATGSANCVTSVAGDEYGVLSGYNAGVGYDRATGLGSVNADNLVTKWSSVSLLPSAIAVTSLAPTTITHGQAVNFNVTVKSQSGTGIPTGTISFEGGPTNSAEGIASFNLSSGTAAGSTELLPGGTYSLIAHYPGDSTYSASDSAPVTVTVNKENSQLQTFLVTFDSSGNILSKDTGTAVYGSPYLLRVNVENASGNLCSPGGTSGASECPTGTVTLKDNGTPIDAGTYTLNSYGYFEDQIVQLSGGANTITAAYSGDNSFSASALPTGTVLNITPAPTTVAVPTIIGGPVALGVTLQIQTNINTGSSGVSPSGSVTFYSNGTPLTGSVSYTPINGALGQPAYLSALLIGGLNAFPSVGTYSITAAYGGNSNYSGATSGAYTVSVKYPTPVMTLQLSSFSVSPGSPITLTALVAPTNSSVVPTGTISFAGRLGPLPGPVSYSTVVDGNGNSDLQATLTISPAFSDNYAAVYSGDTNYPSANSMGNPGVTVAGNDFTMSFPNSSVTLTRGSSTQLNMFIGTQSGTSLVTFSATPCSGMPAETTCTANSPSVQSTSSDLLNLSATAPHSDTRRSAYQSLPDRWITATFMLFGGVLLIGAFSPKRRPRKLLLLPMVMLIIILASCGGGSGSSGTGGGGTGGGGTGGGGGTTDPGTPVGTYTITVMATSGSISHSTNFTLIVQ
jgi:Pro-kumamolisin, activation domain/Bacterial Ig-like domain (group 3)